MERHEDLLHEVLRVFVLPTVIVGYVPLRNVYILFLQHYRILMNIGISKRYLGLLSSIP